MSKKKIPWSSGVWLNRPAKVDISENSIIITPIMGKDFWKKTLYGFDFEDGAALLVPWDTETAMEVSFQISSFTELYDQAGLFLYKAPGQWIKAGIEFNDGLHHISVVVTDGHSDWSLVAVPNWHDEEITIRASIINDAIIIRARTKSFPWRTIRVAQFTDNTSIQAGPFAISPKRNDLSVKFTEWFITEKDLDLHSSPNK